MVALQAGIGATNDLRDAPADRGHKPGKPIPAGLVMPRTALGVAIVAFTAGLALAVPSGPAVVTLAVVVAAIGLAYDLRLKGTTWSWLPFAVGIPLLPVYGWLGAGELPPIFLVVVPTAAVAGTSLAIANALVDLERDRAAGSGSVALALGAHRAWILHAGLLGFVAGAALGTTAALGGAGAQLVIVAAAGLVPLAGTGLVRSTDPRRRERGWELEAVGLALLATAWLAGPALGGPALAGPNAIPPQSFLLSISTGGHS